jgi:lipopolysaccharide export system protein LptA
MAEIKILRSLFKIIRSRHLLYVAVPLLFSATLFSTGFQTQTKGRKKIDLKHADIDYVERDKQTGKDWHRFIGKVWLTHKEISMKCDSAHYFPDKNQVIAFSKIHIEQGDTLDIYGNYLFYDMAAEQAIMNENVELVDKETHLFTNSVKYDVKNEIAQYTDSGRIINGKNKLTSHIGIYYIPQSLFHFKDSVKVVNPDYVMKADTMDYNTATETAFFTGPSEMKGDSIYLYCEKGWYDTKNNTTRIWNNAFIDNRIQVIKGDSMYFDDKSGYGESFGNTTIIDTTNSIIVKGDYAWYYKVPERFMVTDSAMFIQVSGKNDSLFLHADTIKAITVLDSAGKEFRLMRAFYGCRVFSKDLQAKCDSLSYSFQDSVIRLFNQPVLWSAENQLTADTMEIYTKNRKADRLELYYSAFVVSQVDSIRFNQIKGRTLTGHFKDNELYRINIDGNGESIYYLVDGDEIVGKNSGRCASIEILVDKGKIRKIVERQSPEGEIEPPSKSIIANNRLEGFSWLDTLRPKKVADIFK